MAFDLLRARSETPGCAHVAHFNNAGAALMPRPVIDAVVAELELESRIGGYEAAERSSQQLEEAYGAAAAVLGCGADEIALVENATRAWQLAFHSLTFRPGDRILIDTSEYASNYLTLLNAARQAGAVIEVAPDDEPGRTSVETLGRMVDDRVKLIAITHVSTDTGSINPVEEVGRIARRAGIPFLLDACQSVGHLPIDVRSIGCDFLVTSGRKYLRGPRGTGLLYVRRGILDSLETPFLDVCGLRSLVDETDTVRDDARRFETWEVNLSARIGFGVACRYALQWGVARTWARIEDLAGRLRGRLAELPRVVTRAGGGTGIVAFSIEGCHPREARRHLTEQGINLWVTEARLTPLLGQGRGDVLRASLHYYNSETEVDRLVAAVSRLAPGR